MCSSVYICSSYHDSTCREVTGKQALLKWWHGQGGLLDYSNAAAVDWWHKQIDKARGHTALHTA